MKITPYLFFLFLFLLGVPYSVEAQYKRKNKHTYYLKIQGGYFSDQLFDPTYSSHNYLNLAVRKIKKKNRKVKKEKTQEFGIAISFDDIRGTHTLADYVYFFEVERRNFSLESYWFRILKKWSYSRLDILIGTDLTLGYNKNDLLPLNASTTDGFTTNLYVDESNEFYYLDIDNQPIYIDLQDYLSSFEIPGIPLYYNDYKFGVGGRIELNYQLNKRFSLTASSRLILADLMLRRLTIDNPLIPNYLSLRDYVRFELFRKQLPVHLGVLIQLGKIKKTRKKKKTD